MTVSVANSPATPNIPDHVVDDLCSRFIVNIPLEERSDLVRVLFHVELAHWFYIDYYCVEQASLPKVGLQHFAKVIFLNIPFLRQNVNQLETIIDKWRDYKMAVPTYGAILLDRELDHVLLVQGFWAKSSWGFPKGKVNADEDPVVCAIREVLEETGYDCSAAISAKDYIELNIQDTLMRLYIVTGVDKDTTFVPQTRGEIKNCTWFKVSELPTSRKQEATPQQNNKTTKTSAFFMAIPFIKPLRKWISKRKGCSNSLTNTQEVFTGEEINDISIVSSQVETERDDSNFPTIITPVILTKDHSLRNQSTPKTSSKAPKELSNSMRSLPNKNLERRRFWSKTWADLKIDWNQLLIESSG